MNGSPEIRVVLQGGSHVVVVLRLASVVTAARSFAIEARRVGPARASASSWKIVTRQRAIIVF